MCRYPKQRDLVPTQTVHGAKGIKMRKEIEEVVTGIREQYTESLVLADLAEMAHLSPYHLARQFRMETGMPPGAYLAMVRLEAARTRLLRSTANVADICMAIGYDSLGAFTSRFTKTFGLPPGRFRRLAELGPGTVDLLAADRRPSFTYGTISVRLPHAGAAGGEPVCVAAFPLGSSNERSHCVVLTGGSILLCVPAGRWSVRAVTQGHPVPLTAIVEPVTVEVGQTAVVPLTLRPKPSLPPSAYLIPDGHDVIPKVPEVIGRARDTRPPSRPGCRVRAAGPSRHRARR